MNKVNYHLLNVVLFVLIIYLVYQSRSFWLGVVNVSLEILLPFFIAFVIAYSLNPLVLGLERMHVPRKLAIFIVLFSFFLLFGFLLYLIVPIFTFELTNLFDGIISFFKEITLRYNLEFNTIQDQLSSIFNKALSKISEYISNGAINIIGFSFSIISKVFIIFAATIYFLIDMDKIKAHVSGYFLKKNKKIYRYLLLLDKEMTNYLSGFMKIVFISFFEYYGLYLLIGHPDALLLGTLAGSMNLIPYFGGIITNVIALLTAFTVSPDLFVKTCLVFMIFSAIDGYVINPFVYGKSNNIHPLVVIISVFAFGIMFGVMGIIISLPLAIVIISSVKFFKDDIGKIRKKRLFKLYR